MTNFEIIPSFITDTDSDNDNGMAINITIMKGHLSANSQANTNCESTNADMTPDGTGWDKGGADNINREGDDTTITRYIVNNNAFFLSKYDY